MEVERAGAIPDRVPRQVLGHGGGRRPFVVVEHVRESDGTRSHSRVTCVVATLQVRGDLLTGRLGEIAVTERRRDGGDFLGTGEAVAVVDRVGRLKRRRMDGELGRIARLPPQVRRHHADVRIP